MFCEALHPAHQARNELLPRAAGISDMTEATGASQLLPLDFSQQSWQPALGCDGIYTGRPRQRSKRRAYNDENVVDTGLAKSGALDEAWKKAAHQFGIDSHMPVNIEPQAGSQTSVSRDCEPKEFLGSLYGSSHRSTAITRSVELGASEPGPLFEQWKKSDEASDALLVNSDIRDLALSFSSDEWSELLSAPEAFSGTSKSELIQPARNTCVDLFNVDFNQGFDFGLDFGIEDYATIAALPVVETFFTQSESLDGLNGDSLLHSSPCRLENPTLEELTTVEAADRLTGQHCCSICGKVYSKAKSLKRHRRDQHEKIKHICDQCGKEFTRLDSLSRHTIEQHEATLSTTATDSKSRKVRCRICGSKVRPTGLAAHQESKGCRTSPSGLAIESTAYSTKRNEAVSPVSEVESSTREIHDVSSAAKDSEYDCPLAMTAIPLKSDSGSRSFLRDAGTLDTKSFGSPAATGKRPRVSRNLKEMLSRKKSKAWELPTYHHPPAPHSPYPSSIRPSSVLEPPLPHFSTDSYSDPQKVWSAGGFACLIQQQAELEATIRRTRREAQEFSQQCREQRLRWEEQSVKVVEDERRRKLIDEILLEQRRLELSRERDTQMMEIRRAWRPTKERSAIEMKSEGGKVNEGKKPLVAGAGCLLRLIREKFRRSVYMLGGRSSGK